MLFCTSMAQRTASTTLHRTRGRRRPDWYGFRSATGGRRRDSEPCGASTGDCRAEHGGHCRHENCWAICSSLSTSEQKTSGVSLGRRSGAPVGNQFLSVAPDAHGHSAASPPSRSRMPAGAGTAAEASSGGGYAVAVASPNAPRPMPTRSFEVCRPNSPTSLAGANRSCAAPISVPRGSITAPRLAPSCQ
jgi:hypothetical protein